MKEQLRYIKNNDAFKGSNGWFERFTKRYSIKTRRITSVGRNLPQNMNQTIWDHIDEVNNLISRYGKFFYNLHVITLGN